MKVKKINNGGITLIALVITIIVLLILAGVALNAIAGENGILTKAKEAKTETVKAALIEEIGLKIIDNISNETEITQENLESILKNYGTLEGEGDLLDKNLVTEDGIEIKVSEIYKGSFSEKVEEEVLEPGINLNKTEILFNLKIEEAQQEIINATLKDVAGNITWSISNSSVATLSGTTGESITITAKAPGTAILKAKCGEYEKSCNITVNGPIVSVTRVVRNYSSASVTVNVTNSSSLNGTIKYSYYIKEKNADDSTYVAFSENTTETTMEFTGLVDISYYTVKIVASEIANDGQVISEAMTTTGVDWYCFVEGTKVLTENGLKNIEDIKLGELVYTINLDNNQRELKEVTFTYTGVTNEIYEITVGDEIIKATPRHQFYIVDKGWIRAYDIQKGDLLEGKESIPVEITKIEYKIYENPINVYNLTVEGNHNYLITQYELLVHNVGSR